MPNSDLVAAFLAKGGKVTRVAESATNGMTRRDWYNAERGITPPRVETSPRVTVDHLGRNWYTNDQGEILGHD